MGLRVADVEEILWAVSVTPLPDAPAVVEGVINVRGSVIALLDPGVRFGFARRPPTLSDRFVIVMASGRRVGLRFQSADAVVDVDPASIEHLASYAGSGGRLAGVMVTTDGLVLIQDMAEFLTETERAAIDEATAMKASA